LLKGVRAARGDLSQQRKGTNLVESDLAADAQFVLRC
jgi:hypothetical protein